MTKALDMTGYLKRDPRKHNPTPQLAGGIGKKPLTEQEIKWAKERKEYAKAQRALQITLAKLRAERGAAQPVAATLHGTSVTVRQGVSGK